MNRTGFQAIVAAATTFALLAQTRFADAADIPSAAPAPVAGAGLGAMAMGGAVAAVWAYRAFGARRKGKNLGKNLGKRSGPD